MRLWQVGTWDDNEETITVGKGASADVLAAVPEGMGKEQMLAVGMDDGFVRLVGMGGKRPKVIGEVRHDEVEGILGLGFEVGGKMCSGGGGIVKVWDETLAEMNGEEEEEEEEEEVAVNGKRPRESDSEGGASEADDQNNSEQEEEKPKKKKKRKRNKGKDENGGQHIMAFTGID